MSFLRFLMFLSLIVWIGGLIFFPVVAQTAFSVLPSRHLAGSVVGRSLGILHWMAIASSLIFLVSSLIYNRLSTGSTHPFAARHLLICVMLLLTLISQFGIIPRMDTLRASMPGEIDTVPLDDPARMQFDALHVWSTRVEQGVLVMGLVLIYLTAQIA
jgi:Domain of unknown function (DUF4149)